MRWKWVAGSDQASKPLSHLSSSNAALPQGLPSGSGCIPRHPSMSNYRMEIPSEVADEKTDILSCLVS
ncbi:hypothetical protein ACRALDRAFT_1061292 [Sodiomyces alcalophilus JCM 7366]|uniref:uncharacterized protein n=1 Tax=Sodiomyces alcalophilus JCM 7366 TaxID=591952 RepID=UPI0039B68310